VQKNNLAFMKDYKKLNLPLLTKQDEEYKMLIEVTEERERQKGTKTAEKKSGDATEIVIRNHLLEKDFNVTLKPEVKIRGSSRTIGRIDSLLLKNGVDSDKSEYEPNDVRMVIEIKNTGVACQSIRMNKKFNELREILDFRFAVVVLSERLLSPKPYCYAINKEDIGIKKCEVFTCVLRRKETKLYEKAVVIEMLENGELWKSSEWQDFINYLRRE
jgi:hypothetical protein